ncbi:MAG: UDP-N-acetylmuramate dehydrogenase [Candidatus Pacebacteria bacterium]|nr:UDP-N-acetylmuramate dehydrogenase [Candidatus Paceibacterota bacterium]
MSQILSCIPLAPYTTFKVGGEAKYFLEAKNKEDIIFGLKFAYKKNIPFFILGGGSNILVSDDGFNGLIIKCSLSNIKCDNEKIYTESGVFLASIVSQSVKNSLTGMEWASGIPGSVGGAIFGNAGAFDGEIGDIVEKIRVIDTDNLSEKEFQNQECYFGYRNSIFKEKKLKNQKEYIIIEAELKFSKGNIKNIKEKIKYNLNWKKKHQPLDFFSAGCVFKNLETKNYSAEFWDRFPELKKFQKTNMIPAAYLIEKCNLKGKKIGGAMVSDLHSNFILNVKNAKAKDIDRLIKYIKIEVREKYGILLEEEIQRIGIF